MTNPLTDEVIENQKWTDDQIISTARRVGRIAIAIADGDKNELTMRVPAEPDRDADLVLCRAEQMLLWLLEERKGTNRAAAKVIESALAGDGQDAERYRHVRNDASETYALCRGRWDQDRMIWRFVEVIEREEADNLIDADIAAIKGKSHD